MKVVPRIQCTLCEKECKLIEGQRGDCRVRLNLDGKLKTLVYGKPCSIHVDPIEKKPIFHMLPGTGAFSIATAGCNLHCKNCQNWQISQVPPEETRNYDMAPELVVRRALESNCRSIAYTYSEPVIFYEYVLDTAKLAKEAGLKNVLVTAGYIKEEPQRELSRYMDAVNMDLKGFTEEFYQKITTAKLAVTLESLKGFRNRVPLLEITNLVIPTLNDKPEMIRNMCRWLRTELGADTILHFSRFYPMYKLRNLPTTPIDTLKGARDIALGEGLHYVYVGNVPGSGFEDTVCPRCFRTVVGRIGYLVTENNIVDGKCKFCGEAIPGIWQ